VNQGARSARHPPRYSSARQQADGGQVAPGARALDVLKRVPPRHGGRRRVAPSLLDHFVRPREHRERNRQAQHFGGPAANHELELRGLLDGGLGGLDAFLSRSVHRARVG
jgi:hypothetical protein